MKLKRLRKQFDADNNFEGLRRVTGPHKNHVDHDYFSTPKQNKAQRARHKRRLLEKYGPKSDAPRAVSKFMYTFRVYLWGTLPY